MTDQANDNTSFDEYYAYIESKTWDKKRTERLIFDDFQCQICGNRNNIQVHHLVYPIHRNFGTEPISDLITVCESCHMLIDKLRKGQRVEILKKSMAEYRSAHVSIRVMSEQEAEDFNKECMKDGRKAGEISGSLYVEKNGKTFFYNSANRDFTIADIPKLRDRFGEENVRVDIGSRREILRGRDYC